MIIFQVEIMFQIYEQVVFQSTNNYVIIQGDQYFMLQRYWKWHHKEEV